MQRKREFPECPERNVVGGVVLLYAFRLAGYKISRSTSRLRGGDFA